MGYDLHERRFSIASAPHEKVIRITTRHSSSRFKQALWKLQPGAVVNGFSIEGKLVWREEQQYILIAGGVGITPFRSLLSHAATVQLPYPIHLIHAARDNFLFKEEIALWQSKMPALTIMYREVRLDTGVLASIADPLTLYYIAGPKQMIATTKRHLSEGGVAPDRILHENI